MTSLTGPQQSTTPPRPSETAPRSIDLRDGTATGQAPARGPADTATAVTARVLPTKRTVQTRSGSRYEILGREVCKREPHGQRTRYVLIDMRGDRLRYTDGERLYISSPVVGTRHDPA